MGIHDKTNFLEHFKLSVVTLEEVDNTDWPKASPVAAKQEMQEIRVWSMGWEDSPEKEMKTHFSTLAWENPMDREIWQGYSPWDCKELDTTECACPTHTHTHTR